MHTFATKQDFTSDFSSTRPHHKTHLPDLRKCIPEKPETVICNPIELI